MVSVLFIIAALVAEGAAAYKFRDLRADRGNPGLRAAIAGLVFLGAAFLSAAPVVYQNIDDLLGLPNVMRLVAHICIVAFAASIALMLLYWSYSQSEATPRARRRLVGYSAATVLMTVLFVAAPVDEERVDWTVYYGHEPIVAIYLIVYLLSFGAAMLEIARLSHRYAPLVHSVMRVSLRFDFVGACFGLAYCLYKAVYIAALAVGAPGRWFGPEDLISPLLAVPGALLVIIGLTMPAWGPSILARRQRRADRRTYRRLYPLWLDLYTANPEILFGEKPPADPGRDPSRWFSRLAVEIPDGMLRLADFYEPQVQDRARAAAEKAHLDGDDARAVIEATCVAAALAAKAEGRRAAEPQSPEFANPQTLDQQIAWLAKVAHAYGNSAVVASAAQSGSGHQAVASA
ncbi:MAB_1171c family putative transporter [Micromonospora sp. CPCC 206061]|uniref:MAB_1171c family putative transporter n=1 Tax=Micromonospora sp. CPCC 206061 TaxID=3122410 RepID=UPI002FF0B301